MENEQRQEIERKKRYLRRYKKKLACIARLQSRLDALTERIRSIKSPSYSGMPKGSTPVTVDELIADKIELEDRLERLHAERRELKKEILSAIDTLDDVRYCAILEGYFIECLSFEEIADNEGYDLRHIYRLYHEAVSLLTV